MKTTTRVALLAWVLAIAVVLSKETNAYVTNGVTWGQSNVPYSVNTANMDLPDAAVEPAVRSGADVWATQSNASVRLSFTGRSTQTTTTNDGLNLVVFRNASSGSAAVIATTYWWSSGSRIIDADVVFWDAAFQFFSGTTGCSGGFYIEDIAAHEFGHVLGLGHSASPSATMYPSTSSCNVNNRTLDPDDIAGIQALYPPTAVLPLPPVNVRIVN